MNLTKLKQNVGKRLRLLPEAYAWNPASRRENADDTWHLVSVDSDRVTLVNERTQQKVSLAPDHVHHYASAPPDETSFDGVLELNVTIDITTAHPRIELIPSGAARTLDRDVVPPLEVRIPELLNAINPEILEAFKAGSSHVPVMISEHNLRVIRELQGEEDFAHLLALESDGSTCIGIGSRIGGHIHDLDETGTRHGYIVRYTPR